MRKITMILAVLFLSVAFVGEAFADTYVRGYYKRDGTYVQPHYRSSPNKSYNDNWSVRPNVNPYTGKRGTRSPTSNDRSPSSSGYYRSPSSRYSSRNPGFVSPGKGFVSPWKGYR